MTTALTLQNVTKRYDGFVLDDIHMELPSGCIMGLIGENGAGKSTIIKLILGLIHRDGGEITIFGKDNREALKLHKEEIGVVFDESCFPENLNVKDVGRIMQNIYRSWNQSTFSKYVKRFILPEKKAIKDYSRGMKMKLSIAVALSHNVKLLLLDEATSGLDPVVKDEILDIFFEFIQDEQHSILMSSHIISDLEKVCDYITLIHKGKRMFTHSKDELLEEYVILKGSQEQFEALDPSAVVGRRKNSFGVEALVRRSRVPNGFITDRAGIEDIMLFYVKGGQQ